MAGLPRKLIVKKNIRALAKEFGVKSPDNTDEAYRDVMANVESRVQETIEEMLKEEER